MAVGNDDLILTALHNYICIDIYIFVYKYLYECVYDFTWIFRASVRIRSKSERQTTTEKNSKWDGYYTATARKHLIYLSFNYRHETMTYISRTKNIYVHMFIYIFVHNTYIQISNDCLYLNKTPNKYIGKNQGKCLWCQDKQRYIIIYKQKKYIK